MCTLHIVAIQECYEITLSSYIQAIKLKILYSHRGTHYGQRSQLQYRFQHRYLLLLRNDRLLLGITATWRNYHQL